MSYHDRDWGNPGEEALTRVNFGLSYDSSPYREPLSTEAIEARKARRNPESFEGRTIRAAMSLIQTHVPRLRKVEGLDVFEILHEGMVYDAIDTRGRLGSQGIEPLQGPSVELQIAENMHVGLSTSAYPTADTDILKLGVNATLIELDEERRRFRTRHVLEPDTPEQYEVKPPTGSELLNAMQWGHSQSAILEAMKSGRLFEAPVVGVKPSRVFREPPFYRHSRPKRQERQIDRNPYDRYR